jgi:coenzyme F420 hydrogenase subunit beta
MDTIAKIVDEGLCTGCGTCAYVCPNEAVEMRLEQGLYLPKIDPERCNQCGLCVRVCPGHCLNFEMLNSLVFKKQPTDTTLGNYIDCYVGYSNDSNIRYSCSSGGVATHLLVFALEKNLIDAALVTRMKKDSPLESEAFIARTKEDIISASKSKYCPVAVNEALKKIINEDGKFAVVGLPCHIHGIRKAESFNPELKKKIVLHIGLMCAHTISFLGTEFLLEKMSIDKEQVVKLDYRGRGWPGSMSIYFKNNSSLTIPYIGGWNAYWPLFSSFFFTPWRCIMCPDMTNELADISLGDAYLPELKREKVGQSIIVTRTEIAEHLLHLMSSTKAISIKHIDYTRVKQAQAPPLKFKKKDLNARLFLLNAFGKQTPRLNPTLTCSVSPASLSRAFFTLLNIKVSSNKFLKWLLVHLPSPLFRLYAGVYKFF